MIEILSRLSGPEYVIEPGVFGRSIQPSSEFWALWTADKNAVKKLGVRVKPGAGRDWDITWVYSASSELAVTLAEHEAGDCESPRCDSPAPAESGYLTRAAFVCEPIPAGVPWSAEQHAIFEFFRTGTRNLVIEALAGTGKTTTSKIAFTQAPEENMLYAIFGKKNEREAREKIKDPRVTIKTLHALGFSFIQQVWPGSKPDNNIEMVRLEGICGKFLPAEVSGAILTLVGFAKNGFIDPTVADIIAIAEERQIDCDGFEAPVDGGFTVEKISGIALQVVNAARTRDPLKRISFNDMVWLPVAMNWVRPSFDLVLIDEAQDMNMPQLEMAVRACRAGGRIIIVGDNFQAIYGFRGAVSGGMDLMKARLNADTLGLTVTYRCPKAVVALANEYVPAYKAAPDAPEGIVEHIGKDDIFKHAAIGDAILSRANAPLMPICLGLLRKGISARIEGRDIGKMLLGLIRKLKSKSVPDFIRKVEASTERQLERAKARKCSDSQLAVIEDTHDTLIALAEDASSVSAIEQRCLDLFSDSDSNPKPAVVLSSVHKAKGLEWNKVFIIRETFLRPGRVTQEEKNIYYVAITRTKNTLVFVGEGAKEKEKD